ncbi:MAG: hypothetical protein FWC92_04510 [Defluviitaleaceae bacterium]|nr:hypothetical protein [Defluviitaleaceae bacterium]
MKKMMSVIICCVMLAIPFSAVSTLTDGVGRNDFERGYETIQPTYDDKGEKDRPVD